MLPRSANWPLQGCWPDPLRGTASPELLLRDIRGFWAQRVLPGPLAREVPHDAAETRLSPSAAHGPGLLAVTPLVGRRPLSEILWVF